MRNDLGSGDGEIAERHVISDDSKAASNQIRADAINVEDWRASLLKAQGLKVKSKKKSPANVGSAAGPVEAQEAAVAELQRDSDDVDEE